MEGIFFFAKLELPSHVSANEEMARRWSIRGNFWFSFCKPQNWITEMVKIAWLLSYWRLSRFHFRRLDQMHQPFSCEQIPWSLIGYWHVRKEPLVLLGLSLVILKTSLLIPRISFFPLPKFWRMLWDCSPPKFHTSLTWQTMAHEEQVDIVVGVDFGSKSTLFIICSTFTRSVNCVSNERISAVQDDLFQSSIICSQLLL